MAHSEEDDVKTLHQMGYAQELARRMSGFSNFAISFSIICILAGGITAFPLAYLDRRRRSRAAIGWIDRRPVRAGRRPRHGADRLGLSDRRRPLSLVLDPGRPRLGLGCGLDQPARPDLRRRLGQCRHLPALPRPRLVGRVRPRRVGLGRPGADHRRLADLGDPGACSTITASRPRRRSPTSRAT